MGCMGAEDPSAIVWVGPRRGTGLSTSPFPRPALRTGHAPLDAPGSPHAHPAEPRARRCDAGSNLQYPGPRLFVASVRRYSPAASWHDNACVASVLPPFAMWTAFPPSDYYGGSAPPTAFDGRRACPIRIGGGPAADGSHVHYRPVDRGGAQLCPCGLATGTPQSFPVASLPAIPTGPRVAVTSTACTAAQPISARLELVDDLRGFQALVSRVHLSVSLAGPGPSGSAVPSRRCRSCSRPSRRLPARAAPSFSRPAATGRGRAFQPARFGSASWRRESLIQSYVG